MKLFEVEGTYGRSKTPCTVFVAEIKYGRNQGAKWYVAEDSVNVNYTYDEIQEGVDIEELSDDDMFTAGKPITSLEELEEAINS